MYKKKFMTRSKQKLSYLGFHKCEIEMAKEALKDIPKNIFVIPLHIRLCRRILRNIQGLKRKSKHVGHKKTQELKDTEEVLKELLDKMLRIADEYNIKVEPVVIPGVTPDEFENCDSNMLFIDRK